MPTMLLMILLTLLGVGPAGAQEVEITVCLDDNASCFPASAVGFGIVNASDITAGSRRGSAEFHPILLTKAPDEFTPDLVRFASRATVLSNASIEFGPAGAPLPDDSAMTIELAEVLVTKVDLKVADDGTPHELIELDYVEITITVGASTFCWNRATDQAC
jgi:hypothetical protein